MRFDNSDIDIKNAPFKRNKGKGSLARVEQALKDEIRRYESTRLAVTELKKDLSTFNHQLKNIHSIRICDTTGLVKRRGVLTDFGVNVVRHILRWDYLPHTPDRVLRNKPLMDDKNHFLVLASEFPINGLQIMGEFELRRLEINGRFKLHIETISMLMEQIEVLHFIRSQR